jgi:hypothetical protein
MRFICRKDFSELEFYEYHVLVNFLSFLIFISRTRVERLPYSKDYARLLDFDVKLLQIYPLR